MTVAMDGQDKATGNDVIVVGRMSASDVAEGSRKVRVTRKYLILGVSVIVVTALVITGILVGVKFVVDSSHEIVERILDFKDGDQTLNEDVTADLDDNVVQYHVRDPRREVWVVNDFNRDLLTLKMQLLGNYGCFIRGLNRSEATRPENFKNVSQSIGHGVTIYHYYKAAPTPIIYTGFMSKQAQTLCANLDVYWLTQMCEVDQRPSSNTTSPPAFRQKRQLFGCAIGCWGIWIASVCAEVCI